MFTMREAKRSFFDRKAVMDALDMATQKALSRFGSYVRAVAQKSMVNAPAGDYAAPGHPPHAHVGYLKQFLFFYYEPEARTVVIGPTLLPHGRRRGSWFKYTVPQMEEFGGFDYRYGSFKRLPSGTMTSGYYVYPARPYMRPAFERTLQYLPKFYTETGAGAKYTFA